MKAPGIPKNEQQRLEALLQYDILDSKPEKSFDDLTKLASFICSTPISLVTLIDRERQWFKSKYGLDLEETPRKISFCGHAILEPKRPFIINDLRLDDRFRDNPFVAGDAQLVFYAGIPLINSEGYALGTLCVVDHEPKELTKQQLEFLTILAKQVSKLLELRKNNLMLKDSIKTKEVLLQEIHHRVKNNLQIISSMINLSGSETKDKEALRVLENSRERIQAMSLVHQKLYQGEHFGRVNFRSYLLDLIDSLKFLYPDIECNVESLEISLNLDTAVPLSLIVSELVNNSFKHAFPDQKNGEINLSITSVKDHFELKISDNGIGLKENFKLPSGSSVGMEIVQDLCDQIDADLSFNSAGKGTSCLIRFKEVEK